MKIRKGFVSNSSSSSFIIGVSKVKDMDKLKQYVISNRLTHSDITIIKVKELKYGNAPWQIDYSNDKVSIQSFTYQDVSIDVKNLHDEDEIIAVYHTEGDDSDFPNGDDYDIDLDFFSDSGLKIYNMFHDDTSGIVSELSDTAYGAGRYG